MKLISMTDFVLKKKTTSTFDLPQIMWYDAEVAKLDKIRSYAQFLNQPLKLSMLVPCDEDGNYWKYPPTIDELEWAKRDSVEAEQSFKQKEYFYQKAKEKVLFEGFSVEIMDKDILDVFYNGDTFMYYWLNGEFYDFSEPSGLKKIEDLLEIKRIKFTLTKSAIKQIGL